MAASTPAVADGTAAALGSAWADALAAHDLAALRELVTADVEFRALTPRRAWEADTPDAVTAIVAQWLDGAEVREVVSVTHDRVGDRHHVAYRLRGVRAPDGPFVLEQHAYYDVREGRIAWMRVLCSGYRPDA